MAPLPKRRGSTQRKGKRIAARKIGLPRLVKCKHCGKDKLSHQLCPHCHQ